VASPRAAIKQAFNSGIIDDGHAWLRLLNDRNLTSHVYDENTAEKIYQLVSVKYYPLFDELYHKFFYLNNHESE
jgi:nucleotidyltransferase substrate binding protein (TIGR01987 family)